MSDKYIIVWVSEETESQSFGKTPMTKRVAERLRDDLNRKYPEIKHEIKKVQS